MVSGVSESSVQSYLFIKRTETMFLGRVDLDEVTGPYWQGENRWIRWRSWIGCCEVRDI